MCVNELTETDKASNMTTIDTVATVAEFLRGMQRKLISHFLSSQGKRVLNLMSDKYAPSRNIRDLPRLILHSHYYFLGEVSKQNTTQYNQAAVPKRNNDERIIKR